MNQDKAIKILAVTNIVLLPIVVVLGLYLERFLPALLVEFLEQEMERENSTIELVVSLLAIPVLIVHLAALFGVLFHKQWSRAALLYTSVIFYLLIPSLGPYVDHAFSAALDGFSSFLLGALLALLYFGRSTFTKTIHQDSEKNASN